jgi:hypothetical protein
LKPLSDKNANEKAEKGFLLHSTGKDQQRALLPFSAVIK